MNLVRTLFFALCFLSLNAFSQYIGTTEKQEQTAFKLPATEKQDDYLEKTVILKLKQQYKPLASPNGINNSLFNQLYSNIGGQNLRKKFPHAKAPKQLVNERGERFSDLTLIYEFNYTTNQSVEKILRKFLALQLFEYAEPHYLPRTCYTPNDPSLSNQYAIANIQAEAAWGVNSTTARGDTNIVIGITDTGVDPNHPDLKFNIKHNPADPIDGVDNEGDGYIDNHSGWDLGENDNNPTYNANPHGVHVCGIAGASTDNGTGVAGIGFKCKFLPIKISNSNGTLTNSYEGIVYAADHGCTIINCSWGGESASQLGQDVVDYATINMNCLVVAAAGNNGTDQKFYPASYNYVISVANTKSDDRRSSSSNYNYTVDVCAPGESIYSTWTSNGYSAQTGTSMASPCAAGAAAIIKSFYPSFTALQVGARLKTTCDDIYSLMSPVYANKLGNGRINLYKALTQPLSPSIVMTQQSITDNNDNTFVVNDTLRIRGTYTNYLGATTNLTATLSSTSTYVQIIDGTATLGAISTLGTANNSSDPYTVRIKPGTPANQSVLFKLTYSDPTNSYTATEFFNIVVNVDYINITINDVATTIGSNGRIGYSQTGQSGGLGFDYMNNGTLLYESGLMIGINASQVSDAIRGVTVPDADFQSVLAARAVSPPLFSDFDVEGIYNDNLAVAPLPVTVHHRAFAWNNTGDRKYVIVQYVISNSGVSTLNNLYAGLCTDWDIDASTYAQNRAAFDAANKMGYVYHTATGGLYGGVKLLTNTAPVVHYAIDNISGGAGGVDLFDNGFDATEKYTTLSTNRHTAGTSGNGNDIIDVVSTGPYTIAAGDSATIAFAILTGDNLADLQNSAANAQIKYDGLNITTVANYNNTFHNESLFLAPNPAQQQTTIYFSLAGSGKVSLKIMDITGKEIAIVKNENMPIGQHQVSFDSSLLANGIYYCRLSTPNNKLAQKLVITK